MSSLIKASQQPPTTGYSPLTGRFLSGKQHKNWQTSLEPEWLNKQFGLVKVISLDITRRGQRQNICVFVQCTNCGNKKWINRESLLRGLTKGCQSCSQTKSTHSEILGRRYDAIVARCNNPSNRAYKHYGARGIQCKFNSRMEFILWVSQNLPHPTYNKAEIDRIDNNGHYEPGNLRLATRLMQIRNRRCSRNTSMTSLTPDQERDIQQLTS